MSLANADMEQRRGPGRPRRDAETIRPPVRSEDSERAARRAAEIRGNAVSADDGTDAFYIPPEVIPDGWSYEWKREETMGQPDHQHQLSSKRRGWEPVPQNRHPDILVRQQGMILMERPMEITRDSFDRNQRLARLQVQTKEAQLGDGLPDDTRTKEAGRQTFARRSYEHNPIPD